MATRVQVVMSEAEREAFRAQAERDGVSLSAWLREAGHGRLQAARVPLRSADDVDAFFAAITDDDGVEPDWAEHKRAIGESRARGQTAT